MNQKKLMNLTTSEIEQAVYSPGGLVDRIKKKIREIGKREVANKMGISIQHMYVFMNYDRPQFATIFKFGKAVE